MGCDQVFHRHGRPHGPRLFPLVAGRDAGGFWRCHLLHINGRGNGRRRKSGRFVWRPIIYILGGNLAFGVLLGGLPSIGLPHMGLIVGIFALTIICSKAGSEFNWRDVLLLACVLSVGSYLAFIVLLKLQIPVWPKFITG